MSTITATVRATIIICGNADSKLVVTNVTGGTFPGSYLYLYPNHANFSTNFNGASYGLGTYTVYVGSYNPNLPFPQNVPGSLNYPNDLIPFTATVTCIVGTPTEVNDISINPVCNSSCTGSISLVITGGLANPIVQWTGPSGFSSTNPNLINLCQGTYHYIVTNGDTVTGDIELVSASPIISHKVILNTNCINDCTASITLAPTGGTGPYSYLWSTTDTTSEITDLCPGTYTVSITDSVNCTSTESYIIKRGTPISTQITIGNPSTCTSTDGFINTTSTGGIPAYTYFWTLPDSSTSTNQNLSNLGTGTYNFTVTDTNGCTSTNKITLYCFTKLQTIIIRAKCCLADLAYKLTSFKQLGLQDTDCIENKVKYLKLVICLLQKYNYDLTSDIPELCASITSTSISNIIENLNSICGCCTCDFNTQLYNDDL